MTSDPRAERPLIFRVDARAWLREESRREQRPVRLDSIPSRIVDALADMGARWVWLGGAWDTGRAGPEALSKSSRFLEEMQASLPGMTCGDIAGSPLAIRAYCVRPDMGGDEGLDTFRNDLAERGMRLLVDFVADKVALDHPWVVDHPEFFMPGSEEGLSEAPWLYFRTHSGRILSRAIDADSDPLPDALALNHCQCGLRQALLKEFESVLERADGVYLAGASAALPGRIVELWGERALPRDGTAPAEGSFWADTLSRLDGASPPFLLVADYVPSLLEALAVREAPALEEGATARGAPQGRGSVLCLDHALRSCLAAADASIVRDHLSRRARRGVDFLDSLEWIGSPRAAAIFPPHAYPAASLLAYLSGGAALLLDGQMEGRRASQDPRLSQQPEESTDRETQAFYDKLLETIARPEVSRGQASLLETREAWEGNTTHRQFIVFLHRMESGNSLLVAVNYGPLQGQCFVDLSLLQPAGYMWHLQDLFSVAVYQRDGGDLSSRGLYLDLAPWDYNVFELLRGTPL